MVCWCTGGRKLALAIFFNNLSIFLFHGLSSVLWNRRTTTGVESAFLCGKWFISWEGKNSALNMCGMRIIIFRVCIQEDG